MLIKTVLPNSNNWQITYVVFNLKIEFDSIWTFIVESAKKKNYDLKLGYIH